jgi:homocysteine S-methyltransferase
MVAYVRSVRPRHSTATMVAPVLAQPVATAPLAERSRFGARLARGEFITTVEIVPPKGVDPGPMFDQARALKAAGVDAINVPDGPQGSPFGPLGEPPAWRRQPVPRAGRGSSP